MLIKVDCSNGTDLKQAKSEKLDYKGVFETEIKKKFIILFPYTLSVLMMERTIVVRVYKYDLFTAIRVCS